MNLRLQYPKKSRCIRSIYSVFDVKKMPPKKFDVPINA